MVFSHKDWSLLHDYWGEIPIMIRERCQKENAPTEPYLSFVLIGFNWVFSLVAPFGHAKFCLNRYFFLPFQVILHDYCRGCSLDDWWALSLWKNNYWMELARPASSNLMIFNVIIYINEVFTTENIIDDSYKVVTFYWPVLISVNDWSCILYKCFNH